MDRDLLLAQALESVFEALASLDDRLQNIEIQCEMGMGSISYELGNIKDLANQLREL